MAIAAYQATSESYQGSSSGSTSVRSCHGVADVLVHKSYQHFYTLDQPLEAQVGIVVSSETEGTDFYSSRSMTKEAMCDLRW